ncbi:hypothetical protein HS088_TW07G00132 [Tripterygium wilfordii]|uniref:Uncharacterized protein n=1 Tax=Tripterygium wilfordii TaxID=458696 RepID=A0A7J7DE58_TRIWF|nr:hypothetical protein HS088_TW07G00132 [Tripterygium wilfordii]
MRSSFLIDMFLILQKRYLAYFKVFGKKRKSSCYLGKVLVLFVWPLRKGSEKKKEETMEGSDQVGSSSFTTDCFGTKEPKSSSKGTFATMFPPPSVVLGKKSSSSEIIGCWERKSSINQWWINNQGTANCNIPNKGRILIFQEEKVEPCHLSSSLYYGGQDNYTHSSNNQSNGSYPTFKKDGGEGDSNGNSAGDASRGNWWQGSLYY